MKKIFTGIVTWLGIISMQSWAEEAVIMRVADPEHVLIKRDDGSLGWMGHRVKLSSVNTGAHVEVNPLRRFVAYDWLPSTGTGADGREDMLNHHKLIQVIETENNTHAYLKNANGEVVVATFDGKNRLPLTKMGSYVDVTAFPAMRAEDSAPAEESEYTRYVVMNVNEPANRARVRRIEDKKIYEVRTNENWKPHQLQVGTAVGLRLIPKLYSDRVYVLTPPSSR